MLSPAESHILRVQDIQRQVNARGAGQSIRISHGSTNSTRHIDFHGHHVVDTSALRHIIEINVAEQYVIVEPSVQMDELVEATLQYNLLPPVVMEFPGISVGGGVQGGAAESSSFKYSGFHHTALEYEYVLGDGSLLVASPDKHADFFWGSACSYGSLGILTSVKLRLIPAEPYVHVTYSRHDSIDAAIAQFDRCMKQPNDIDFVDGIMYSPQSVVVMQGTFARTPDAKPVTFLRASDEWFYLHVKQVMRRANLHEEWIPIRDYLFRYDRGAFWVGSLAFEYAHIPFTRLTRRMLDGIMHTRVLYRGVQRTNVSQKYFVQDIFLPKQNIKSLVAYIENTLHIWPVWLLPIHKHNQELDIFGLPYTAADYIINVGVWGKTNAKNFDEFVRINRDVEQELLKREAHKTLYAHSYFPEDEFWTIYDRQKYLGLRKKYKAEGIFTDIYPKITVSHAYNGSFAGAIWGSIARRLSPKRFLKLWYAR